MHVRMQQLSVINTIRMLLTEFQDVCLDVKIYYKEKDEVYKSHDQNHHMLCLAFANKNQRTMWLHERSQRLLPTRDH
jgi:hypothetical protein